MYLIPRPIVYVYFKEEQSIKSDLMGRATTLLSNTKNVYLNHYGKYGYGLSRRKVLNVFFLN